MPEPWSEPWHPRLPNSYAQLPEEKLSSSPDKKYHLLLMSFDQIIIETGLNLVDCHCLIILCKLRKSCVWCRSKTGTSQRLSCSPQYDDSVHFWIDSSASEDHEQNAWPWSVWTQAAGTQASGTHCVYHQLLSLQLGKKKVLWVKVYLICYLILLIQVLSSCQSVSVQYTTKCHL